MADRRQGGIPDRADALPCPEALDRCAREYGERTAMRVPGESGYRSISYAAFGAAVKALARFLAGEGLPPAGRVAVLAENRPEWIQAYLAAITAGGVAVPVDRMMPGAAVRHVLADSEAGTLFVSGRTRALVEEMEPVPSLERIIDMDGGPGALSWEEAVRGGERSGAALPETAPDRPAAILYTSGTTGHSKGVVLSQNNIASNVDSASRVLRLGGEDVFLSVLPMHHAYETMAGTLLPLSRGASITFARSMKSADLVAGIRETGVTVLIGVPLLYEKMRGGILRTLRRRGRAARLLFGATALLAAAGESAGREWGERFFRPIRRRAGLGSIRFLVSGGGPLDPALSRFFTRFGLPMLQGYGLTETSPLTHVNPPGRIRHGTVGPPIDGVECRIDLPDREGVGEILIRGPNVFLEYHGDPEGTAEAFDEDGWFRTGDLGRIDRENYLTITGRRKNVIVTYGGKNVYPEEAEMHLERSPFIAEVLVVGAPRAGGYGEEPAALLHPDYERIDLFFEREGRRPSDRDVAGLLRAEMEKRQAGLEPYKRARRFRVVEEEFARTSTRKIKRYLYDGGFLDAR